MQDQFKYKVFAEAIIDEKFRRQSKDRKNYGLIDLSKQIGISKSTLHRAIQGKKISLETTIRICKWMGHMVDNFVINL